MGVLVEEGMVFPLKNGHAQNMNFAWTETRGLRPLTWTWNFVWTKKGVWTWTMMYGPRHMDERERGGDKSHSTQHVAYKNITRNTILCSSVIKMVVCSSVLKMVVCFSVFDYPCQSS